jgi:hypothetical protein
MALERHREEREVAREAVTKAGEADEEAGAKTDRLINDLPF